METETMTMTTEEVAKYILEPFKQSIKEAIDELKAKLDDRQAKDFEIENRLSIMETRLEQADKNHVEMKKSMEEIKKKQDSMNDILVENQGVKKHRGKILAGAGGMLGAFITDHIGQIWTWVKHLFVLTIIISILIFS
jgi:chromosome segregation ATPase